MEPCLEEPRHNVLSAVVAFVVCACALSLSGCCGMCGLNPVACSMSKKCKERGHCTKRGGGDIGFQCYAGSDDDCAQSKACASEGKCHATERGTCVVKEEVEENTCAQHPDCKRRGGCAPNEGNCIPRTDADCRDSLECRTLGKCKRVHNGKLCRPTLDAHCQESVACKANGGCSAVGQRCRPTRPEHCTASTGCELDGLCELREGRCVLPDAPDACEGHLTCTTYGRCLRRPDRFCGSKPPESCLHYCGRSPDEPARAPCAYNSLNHDACRADGRCIRDERDVYCVHVPPGKP